MVLRCGRIGCMIRIVIILAVLLAGCVSSPCPPQDLYYMHYHYDDDGEPISVPLFIEEGFFDFEDCCKTPEEFKEFVKEFKAFAQEQRELEYERRYGSEPTE